MADYPHAPAAVRFDAPAAPPAPTPVVDPAFVSWATTKGWTLNPWASAGWFQSWGPFVFLPNVESVGLELNADFGEADVWLVEAFDSGSIEWDKKGARTHGGDKTVVAFVTSQKLSARAAVRARIGAALKADLGHTIGNLFHGGDKKSGLNDDRFESMFEIAIPGVEEGGSALTPALRQHLLTTNFRGIVELRPGGMICTSFGHTAFDAPALEKEIAIVGDVYRAAVTR